MRQTYRNGGKRYFKFFRIAFCYETLTNYYITNSFLVEYNYSLSEIDEMMPYEKEIYLNLLLKKLHEKHEAMQKAANRR